MLSIPNTIDEPIFIVGVTRSGTTLLEQVLNRHPHLSIYHELHFLRRVWIHANTPTLDAAQLQEAISQLVNLADEGLKAETIVQRFSLTDRSPRALYDTILRLRMEGNGKLRMGEKTPSNFWFLDVLFAWYPKARVIYTIRNPHSVHGSFKNYRNANRMHWRDRTVFGRALYWNYGARALRESQAKYPGQVMCIAFEDLVKRPDKTLPAVCDFLGEAYCEDMLEITAVNSSFDQTSQRSGFRKETLQRYMHLNFLERLLIDLLSGAYMMVNDYPLAVLPKWVIRILDALGFYSALNLIHGAIRRHRRQWPVNVPKLPCEK
jgi:hypothetical protein